MKTVLKSFIIYGVTAMSLFSPGAKADPAKTAYDFTFETLGGEAMPLSQYRGKVLLVVNTASQCGFTPQYESLENLYETYKDRGLVVIGVPSNDFGGQEPGTAQEIKAFCQLNYGVTFPLTSKQVVSGRQAHPFYQWVYSVLGFGSAPKWNFHKYLIDPRGRPVDYFVSTTAPDSARLITAIEKLLPTADNINL
jgi:glutathione peroxidase